MNILLLLGFEGGEETGRPISSPPPTNYGKSQTLKLFVARSEQIAYIFR